MTRRSTARWATGLAMTGVIGLAAPATAAEPGPSPNASCVGTTFERQATGEPGAIARRIAEIKGFIDVPFGVVIGDFARWDEC